MQILGKTSNMTAKKVRNILLKDERRQAEKNSDKISNVTILANRNSNHQSQKASGCSHCHKSGHKKIYVRKSTRNLCQLKLN